MNYISKTSVRYNNALTFNFNKNKTIQVNTCPGMWTGNLVDCLTKYTDFQFSSLRI